MFVLIGKVLGVEHKAGTDRESGQPYSYYVYHVLTGFQTQQVKVADSFGPAPTAGEDLTAEAQVRGTSRGNLSVTLLRRLKPVRVESAPPVQAAQASGQ